jgi:uncharacterized membrane protein
MEVFPSFNHFSIVQHHAFRKCEKITHDILKIYATNFFFSVFFFFRVLARITKFFHLYRAQKRMMIYIHFFSRILLFNVQRRLSLHFHHSFTPILLLDTCSSPSILLLLLSTMCVLTK